LIVTTEGGGVGLGGNGVAVGIDGVGVLGVPKEAQAVTPRARSKVNVVSWKRIPKIIN